VGAMLFCNIGWMSRYEGLAGKRDDDIVGGGRYVDENKTGNEVCNFLHCRDGYVYGHVESWQGEKDRKIRIEAIGGSGDYVDGVDVVWTAPHPKEVGRRVVGWYPEARVFRERQQFSKPPSRQHARDEIGSYRIRALAERVRRLDYEDRALAMGHGTGWMGQTPWWVPSNNSPPEVRKFVRRTRQLLDGLSGPSDKKPNQIKSGAKTPGPPDDPYSRYVEAYEVRITPRHSTLQTRFERFLASDGVTEIRPNVASVDLRYRDANKGPILVEIKPCEPENARYAIRTAIGQLLDYRQRAKEDACLLIVVETKPTEEDRLLATFNGFGIAYPAKGKFEVLWPTQRTSVDARH
jgi:hypothetical protein